MITRRNFVLSTGAALALPFSVPASAASHAPLKVVTTFSILGDMVRQIGGKHVKVTSLVGPNGDTHVYRPTPADAKALSQADVLVVNGLQFEGWLDRLSEASDFKGIRTVATSGIEPIVLDGKHEDHDGEKDEHHKDEHDEHHKEEKKAKAEGHDKHDEHHKEEKKAEAKGHDDHDDHGGHDGHDHGTYDPHAWQSLKHAVVYADNIAAGLAKANPEHASDFYRNRAAYVKKIRALDKEIKQIISAVPENKRTIVTSHDAFQYFGRDYHLKFIAPQGLSTDSEASAKDVAELIRQIRKEKIRAVFLENITDTRLLKQIADETGAAIGGTLYPGALSEPTGPAPTYLQMIRHNAVTLSQALSS